jgi:hypothetical protein
MGNSSATTRPYWSASEIQRFGDSYINWLYHIRHRGTFSSISPDFERFINTVSMVNVPDESQRTLRQSWLDVSFHCMLTSAYSLSRLHGFSDTTRSSCSRHGIDNTSISSYSVLHPRSRPVVSQTLRLRSLSSRRHRGVW